MHRANLRIALLAISRVLFAQAPVYSAEGVVNSASWEPGNLAPYTFATIFGEHLADETRSRTEADPDTPGLGAVSVRLNGIEAMVFYISPEQVNFLVPIGWAAQTVKMRLSNRGISGPEVVLQLGEYAPALFQLDAGHVVAQRWPWYSVATPESPARPGDIVILYATGLGNFKDFVDDKAPPRAPLEIAARRQLRVLLDSIPVEDSSILYAGAVDQHWGLYQINLLVPEDVPDNPTIQLAIGDYISTPGVRLPLRRE
ncbi:MAG TPA: hypothetical protein PLK67_12815 [Bryobacteraceae bacterium]|nr:hypothetical protein [Bryobacteraceae bacterium]